ncbi:dynein axonemal heavy chain 10 [Parasteatoda tepidariorum]|uniref:dynein axonemal heavy chain 10 n=1 Tax=Parasteatoda tepidariorum TaxID=114398 RepID=UPI0039BD642C
MNVSSDDFILTCVKNIVYKYLVIDINDSSFENFLSEDKNKDIVLNVLSEPNESQKCLFFYKTIIEEEIEPEDELPNIEEKPMSKVALDILKSLDIIDINAENRQDTNASESALLATSNIEPEDEKDQSDHSLHSVSTSGEEHEPKEGNIEEIPEVLINDDTEDSDENENPDEDKENGKKESRERLTKSRTSLVMIVKKIKLQMCLNVAEYEPSQQYVYFLKRVDDILPPVHSAEEAHRMIMHYFEVGYLSQHPLVCIDKVISLLYMPMLAEENLKAHVPSKLYKIKHDQISSLFAGFQKHMKDLRDITRQMISQTETPFIFTLPEIPEDSSLEQLAQETVFTTEADCLMREWNDRILDLLEQITQEKPEEKNLLEEVKFWDNQKWKVGVCHDQLNHTAIKETIQVLKLANCSVAKFETNVTMVENQLHKITEIINYLILLVPYTKNILSEDYTLEEWKKNLEQVFVVLKVMWMQSDYFKKVDNMSRIFKSISILLKQKVKELARIDVLFKKPLQKVKQIVTDSVEVLSFWKKLYMEESENVKKFGSAYWWTFDIRHFFNDTDYIIIICKDIENIANKLHELHNIFNTHLRLFVENVKELNALRSRIFSMTLIIQYVRCIFIFQ